MGGGCWERIELGEELQVGCSLQSLKSPREIRHQALFHYHIKECKLGLTALCWQRSVWSYKRMWERCFLWILQNCSAFYRESSLNYKIEMNVKWLTTPDSIKRKKKKKIAVNSSRNGLTIGNIQEWVPSSRKIMKDTGCPWSGQKVAMLGNPGFLWPHPATIKIGDFMLTQF